MSKFSHMMIDIETLGHLRGSRIPVVTEIGVVCFNTDPEDGSFFAGQINLSVEKCTLEDFYVDDDTVAWWFEQDPQKLQDMLNREGAHPRHALAALGQIYRDRCFSRCNIWAKSPSFDLSILGEMARKISADVWWKYYQERDVRTACEMAKVPDKNFPGCDFYGVQEISLPDGQRLHDALYDAIKQANMVRAAFSRVKSYV